MITREAFGGHGWREMVALRHAVLRAPLGLAFSPAELEAEADQVHLALWRDGALAGTLLLIAGGDEATLRQMAIRPGYERRGLGSQLVAEGERLLLSAGTARVRLSARQTAASFYGRLGYAAEGPPFTLKTIPHLLMRKVLRPAA